MDLANKKVELIEWITRLQDEHLIQQVENLRLQSVLEAYQARTPETTDEIVTRLNKSEEAIRKGNVYSQAEIEAYFESKFKK